MMKKAAIALLVLLMVSLPGQAIAASRDRSIVMFGQDVVVNQDETVDSVVIFAGSAESYGDVNDDVVILGGRATITGRVAGDVVVLGGQVSLQDQAEIMGDLTVIGGSIERSGNPAVHGRTHSGPWHWVGWRHNFSWSRRLTDDSLWSVLWIAFLGWLIFSLLPQQVNQTAAALQADPAKAALFGLLGYVAFVPLVLVLLITLVGIPLIPVLALILVAARVFGQVALGVLAGQWLSPRLNLQTTPVLSTVLGLIALGLLTLLPVVGTLASLFYSLVGLGTVIRTRFGTKPLTV